MDLYRENILDHYKNPRNFGGISSPSKSEMQANPSCGDSITMNVVFKDNRIDDIKFTGVGCAISIASASMLTEKVKGQSIEFAAKIGEADIEQLLGIQLSPSRKKCAMLSVNTLKKILLSKLKES